MPEQRLTLQQQEDLVVALAADLADTNLDESTGQLESEGWAWHKTRSGVLTTKLEYKSGNILITAGGAKPIRVYVEGIEVEFPTRAYSALASAYGTLVQKLLDFSTAKSQTIKQRRELKGLDAFVAAYTWSRHEPKKNKK